MKFGIVVFPGSNCDHDVHHVVTQGFGREAVWLWHKDESLRGVDCVVLPGGFSYGDYLRSGAIARFSPLMEKVVDFAERGGLVLGICNGFQILLEAGLLPGAMRRNRDLRFVCDTVTLRLETEETPFTGKGSAGRLYRMPIAHGDGNYYADEATLDRLERNRQIVFRYAAPDGNLSEEANPNGSVRNIAGIVNERRNVLGMMPHPERCSEKILGNTDGRMIFESLLA
jgi:phosphoribosylformylglycinamidine synthase